MSIEVPHVAGVRGKRVVVTGAAGFIGSALCRVLITSGADVTGYDNFATGTIANIDSCLDDVGAVPRFVHGDVRDWEKLARVFSDAEIVYHLACLGVRHSLHSPHENHEVNATGTLSVLSQARARGVRRVVHTSSSEVYGTARTVPMTEDHPTVPHTVYGASKLAGECYARAFHSSYGYDTVVVRPFNAYGRRSHHEGDSGEVIPRFIVRALNNQSLTVFGDGTQTRDLTHVYDTASAIATCGVTPGVAGETFNIGSEFEVSVNELAETVNRVTGRDVPIEHLDPRPGDVLRLYADSTKARAAIAYRPAVSLEEGITDLAAWFASFGADGLGQLAAAIKVRNWD